MAQEGDLKINIDSTSAVTARKNLADLAAIGERAQKSIEGTADAAAKMGKGFTAGQRAVATASRSIDDYVKKLELTAFTNGKGARETKLYELAVQGASKAQIQAADSALRLNESYEKGIALGQKIRLGLIGVAAAAGTAAVATVATSIKLLDSLDDMAEKTGISVENLSALRFASEAAGTPIEALSGGLTKLSRLMAESAGGNKEAKATFEALGIAVTNTDGTLRSSEAVLGDLANRFSGYEDGAAKAALAQRVFGKSGEDMLPLLNKGANGIADLRTEAEKLGAVYRGDLAKDAGDFEDNLKKIKLASEASAVSIAGPLISALAKLSGQYLEAKRNGESFLPVLAALAKYATPAGQLVLAGQIAAGTAINNKPKTTADIQAFVNSRGATNAGGGRGFVNPKVAAPVVETPGRTGGGGRGRVDHSAEQEAKERLARDLERIRNAQGDIVNTISNAEKVLEAKRSAALVDESAYYDAKRALLVANNSAQQDGIREEIKRLQQEQLTGKEAIANVRKIEDAEAKLLKTQKDGATAVEVLGLQQQGSLKRIADSYDKAQEAAKGYLDTIARGYGREIAGVGRGDKFRADQSARGAIDDRRQELETQYRGELRRKEITEDAFDQYLKTANDTYGKEIALYEQRTKALEKLQASWIVGAKEALSNYYDESQQIAKHSADVVGNAFKGLEDQLTNLLTGGKFDAKTLLKSIGSELTRNTIKEQITGPLANAVNGLLKMPTIAGAEGALSAVTGGATGAGAAAAQTALAASATGATAAISALAAAASAASLTLGASGAAGAGTDVLGAFIAGLGGRANGGPVSAGSAYEINERGAGEFFQTRGGRQFFMPAFDGEVVPQGRGGRGGGGAYAPTINVSVDGQVSNKTRQQIAADVARELRMSHRNT